jgi:hypothetical protein
MEPAMNKFLLTVAAVAMASAAQAQEETAMTMEEIPPTVMEAANAANTMGGTFESVAMDDGVYELAGTLESGMGFEVDVAEDGSVEEVEEQIEASELPEAVAAALEENLPGFAPDYIERSTRPEGVIVYEFEGTHDGAEIDAEIAEDGTGFESNADAAG